MNGLAPIFFIGFPRSGTTLTFEAFSRHESLGWPSLYTERFPSSPSINVLRRLFDNRFVHLTGKKRQYGKTPVSNRLLPQPSEAYRFWDLYTAQNFSRGYLHEQIADPAAVNRVHRAVRRLLFWQGRSRFTAKITGPPRITFLDSIFPDSKFVHIVRDGRAAVHSLLVKVAFWHEKGGYNAPFWSGGLSDDDLRPWRDHGNDPGVLAGLQWKRVLDITEHERQTIQPDRYAEIRYEDFVDSPHEVLSRIYEFCDLSDSPLGHQYLRECAPLTNMNEKYRSDFSIDYIEQLTQLMEPTLRQFNYTGSHR